MSILKYCGIALLALALLFVLGELSPKLSKISAVSIGIAILCTAGAKLYPSLSYIIETVENSPLAEWSSTILKALGVAVAVEVTADACRDAGEGGLASKLELIGKAELLVLSLPLVKELLELARVLMI